MYTDGQTDRRRTKKRMFTTSKCSHLFFCIVYIHISNGYNTWTALSNSHPRSLLASIYPFRIKIKPKHLASYFHFYFYLNMLQTILHTHFTTSNRYIWSIFFRKMFFYMLLCKWLWSLTDVGQFSLLHSSSFGSSELKGGYCENNLNIHVWTKAMMDRHTGNVIPKELLWWDFYMHHMLKVKC